MYASSTYIYQYRLLDDSPPALRNRLVPLRCPCALQVRCWEVDQNSGKTQPKAQQTMGGPVLDVAWADDGTKVFMAGCDNTVRCWDLASNQTAQVAQHDAPVKTVHWVKAPNYTCIMTGSWDKTLKVGMARCARETGMGWGHIPLRRF